MAYTEVFVHAADSAQSRFPARIRHAVEWPLATCRPHFREVLSAIDFIVNKNYHARGEA